MNNITLPNYRDGSIVNLMSSVLAGIGQPAAVDYAPLPELTAEQVNGASNVVLMVLDGLGYDYLAARPDSTLARHLCRPLDAVAPPTTAASVTTFLTGLAPQQHGLTGWFTWFREIGSVVTVLPFTARCNRADLRAAGITPAQLYRQPSIFNRMTVDCYNLLPYWLSDSAYNAALLGRARQVLHHDLSDYFAAIVRTVKASSARKYLYAYWPQFDGLAHEHGVASAEVAAHFDALDQGFTRLLAALAGTNSLLLVTADHGFIDTTPASRLLINDMPELRDALRLPLCGEPRLVHAHVRPECRADFAGYVQSELAHAAVLYDSAALVDAGLYGLGEPHPELRQRVGDFTLVMQDNYILTQQLPGERPLTLIGHHGGLSQRELRVPLVVVDC